MSSTRRLYSEGWTKEIFRDFWKIKIQKSCAQIKIQRKIELKVSARKNQQLSQPL